MSISCKDLRIALISTAMRHIHEIDALWKKWADATHPVREVWPWTLRIFIRIFIGGLRSLHDFFPWLVWSDERSVIPWLVFTGFLWIGSVLIRHTMIKNQGVYCHLLKKLVFYRPWGLLLLWQQGRVRRRPRVLGCKSIKELHLIPSYHLAVTMGPCVTSLMV